MKNDIFEQIKVEVVKCAMALNDCADLKDVKRNHVNYGCLITWQRIARQMGHNTDTPVWEDENGCLRVPFIEIDSYKVEFHNGK